MAGLDDNVSDVVTQTKPW